MAETPVAPLLCRPGPLDRADPWPRLRALTPARVGLSRSGEALGLTHVLELQSAHAAARDAVHAVLDADILAAQLSPLPSLTLRSAAPDRATYLRRPDLGRRLDPACLAALEPPLGGCDIAFVLADGLSAGALPGSAPALVKACIARLPGLVAGPVAIASQARVAIGDEIGCALRAGIVVVLIGERPGLSVAESLGAYLTWAPRLGRQDSERNCVSNIHAHGGLAVEPAAALIARLVLGARMLKLSGVALKDASVALEAGQGEERGCLPLDPD